MKKKILIGVGAFVVVVGVVLAIVAANLGKIVNSRKGELLAQAKTRIGRDISVGDVGVALWPGIGVRVSDVTISDDPAFSADPFVQAKELRVNVKFFPLLKKQVEIKRLVLKEPAIVIVKGEGGRFNFTSLVEAAAPPTPRGQAARAKPASGMAAVLAVADVEDGSVRYVDRVAGVDRTVRDIDFTGRDIGVGKTMHVTVAAAVFGGEQDVRFKATAGPIAAPNSPEAMRATPLSVTARLEPVRIVDLMAATAKSGAPAAPAPEGVLEADATVSGTLGATMIDEIVVKATTLGASEPNATLTASAGPFDLLADSTLVFAAAQMKGTLAAGPIPLAGVKLKPAKPDAPAPVLGGDLRADANFSGAMTAINFDGVVDATNASCAIPGQFEKKPGTPAKVTVKGVFHPEKTPGEGADLSSIEVVFHALTASGSGRFVPFKGREAMEITLDGKTAIGPWKDLMPAMAPFAPTGDATLHVRVSGAPKPGVPPQIEGTANVKHFGAVLAQMPKPVSDGTAAVVFTAKMARVSDARFKIGGSAFRLDADVSSFAPMQATYTLTSAEVHRLDVQAPAPGAKPVPRPEVFRDVVAKGSMKETAPRVAANEIALSSKSGIASNIDYTDFAADVRATPEKAIIDRYSAKAMGGTLSGSGTFEPKLAKFDVATRVEKVNLAEYFRYKSPALADVLVGRLDADMALSGQGKTWEDIQKTLAGKGGALVIEGALLNVNIADEIISSIQGMPMVPTDLTARMKARNPRLFAENKTVFQNLSSKITIADGKIQAPDLKLATTDFALTGNGWFSLGKEMSMNSTLTLSKKLTSDLLAEVPAAKFLLMPDGTLQVPLSFSGALMKPTVKVDAAAMQARFQKAMLSSGQEQVQDALKDGAKGLLNNLNKKKAPAKPPASPAPDSTRSSPGR